MNRQPFERPPQWWSPKLSPLWIRFWKPFIRREQVRRHHLLKTSCSGLEHVRAAMESGCGILITPNHPGHADCFSLYSAAHELNSAFYVMVAWQVFDRSSALRKMILRHHGCFSVDREGIDVAALRQARSVLESSSYPLVIFPEGEVYHLNDRVTPFREGPMTLALMAAKKANRPIVTIPCGIRYRYVRSPLKELEQTMSRIEESLHWLPWTDGRLSDRIYRVAEGLIALKEIEYLGGSQNGSLPERIQRLIGRLLGKIETRHGLAGESLTIPERVKTARQAVINRLGELTERDPQVASLHRELDELFMVVQAFSYPGNYVMENPSIERMAETIDKFEEDVLGVPTASIRGGREATITFGEPMEVVAKRGGRALARDLTREIESRVQGLLDASAPGNRLSLPTGTSTSGKELAAPDHLECTG